ncbi:hypothetical protein HALA3H3_340009 [Halomonas sp. A3H3]|nr:hypothetical protein HALA3H3_340009 [Halomonas sp. A3H3]
MLLLCILRGQVLSGSELEHIKINMLIVKEL